MAKQRALEKELQMKQIFEESQKIEQEKKSKMLKALGEAEKRQQLL